MRRPRPISRHTVTDDSVVPPDAANPAPAAPGSLLRRAWLRATGRAAEPEPSDAAGAPRAGTPPDTGPTPDPAEPGAGPDRIAVPPADGPRSRRKAR
jgi:hypothetical protein